MSISVGQGMSNFVNTKFIRIKTMKNPPDWSSSEFKWSVDMIVTEKSAVVVEAGN